MLAVVLTLFDPPYIHVFFFLFFIFEVAAKNPHSLLHLLLPLLFLFRPATKSVILAKALAASPREPESKDLLLSLPLLLFVLLNQPLHS